MATRNILREKEPALRKISKAVTDFSERLWILLDDMADTMYKVNGAGLAAPQVGVLRRAVIIDVGDGLIELVNPEITTKEGTVEDVEGCLSSPGEYGYVPRPESVTVEACDRKGVKFTLKGEGYLARAICHEVDHLNGVLFKDLATRMLDPEELENRKR